jgi:hypothetical protein
MPAEQAPFITPETYLKTERLAEYKSEYFAGQVFPEQARVKPMFC